MQRLASGMSVLARWCNTLVARKGDALIPKVRRFMRKSLMESVESHNRNLW